ncbi:MAG: hypothetical protein PHE84_09925 [bacterium]|nr:hypothetical protein [bacterium]
MNKTWLFWLIFLGMLALSVSIEPNSRPGFAASSAIGPQASSPIFSCFGDNNRSNPTPPADTTPPETLITSNPPNPSGSTDATFEFTCNEGSCTYDCQIDGGGWSPCTSSKTYSGLSDGSHTFEAKAYDGSGNVDLSPASYSWAILTPWAKSYSGLSEEAHSIQQTSDGGYIVAGCTDGFNAIACDAWVLKLKPDGTVAWQKTYGGNIYNNGGMTTDPSSEIKQTSDGGYILAGFTYPAPMNLWVLKLNSDGTVAWQKTYNGNYAHSIQQTSDGGYILAGETTSFGAGGTDFWVLKLNPDGTVAWQKTYGGTGGDYPYSIQQTSDGGFVIAGHTTSFGAGGYDAWVLKLNPDGTVAWQKAFGGTDVEKAFSIQQTSDGGFIIAGYTKSFGAGNYDAWVLKLNSDGTMAWQKAYGGTWEDHSYSIQQTSDGGYILAGYISSSTSYHNFWVLKLNPDGTVAWQKTYGGTHGEAYSIQQTSDGYYIVAGLYSTDFWVLKLPADGNIIFNATSGEVVTDTNATVTDTTAAVTDTAATVTDTNTTVNNTNATITNTNAIIKQQAP